MGSPTRYACCGKKMLSWIYEKIVIQESTPRSGKFFASDSIIARNGTLACNGLCTTSESYSTITWNGS
jgi:hypothetical protein